MCEFLRFCVFLSLISYIVCSKYYVSISNDGPVVLGANITFKAEVTPKDGSNFTFIWNAEGIPSHNAEFDDAGSESSWTISFPSSVYPPGTYQVQVTARKGPFFWYDEISAIAHFNLTYFLNGDLQIIQNNSTVDGQYVSSFYPLLNQIHLRPPDYEFIMKNATSITTYWFIDCNFWGQTDNFSLIQEFRNATESHDIEAVVVVSYEPIVIPTTTTTTTTTTTPKTTTTTQKPTTTTQKPTTTTQKPTTTTQKPSSTTTTEKLHISKRSTSNYDPASQLPICLNQTTISMDPNKTYGYFHRKIIVQEPVSNLSINGNNWLQHKDMLNLQVKCKGSPPFEYCTQFKLGVYNVTGKETCRNPVMVDSCDFSVVHYFSNADIHSVVIIVSNNIHKNVSRVVVRFYEVTTKAQLSVIVVPVSFSIIAVILIVFGVAYYIQNRARLNVEVADFNFGHHYNDMEYKTFVERLRENFNNAINWGTTREIDSPTSPPWPSSDNNKYGTMT